MDAVREEIVWNAFLKKGRFPETQEEILVVFKNILQGFEGNNRLIQNHDEMDIVARVLESELKKYEEQQALRDDKFKKVVHESIVEDIRRITNLVSKSLTKKPELLSAFKPHKTAKRWVDATHGTEIVAGKKVLEIIGRKWVPLLFEVKHGIKTEKSERRTRVRHMRK